MKNSNELTASYKQQKKTGISTLSILLPTSAKKQLEDQADGMGLTLASYCRSILLGKEFRLLKNHKVRAEE